MSSTLKSNSKFRAVPIYSMGFHFFVCNIKVRNFPRLRFEPKGWRRVGSNPKDGSLRFFATLPEGLDFGTLQVWRCGLDMGGWVGRCLYLALPLFIKLHI